MAQSMLDVRMGKIDPKCGTALAYMMVAYLKAMEVSAEQTPRTSPSIYRGLTTMARVVRPEETPEKAVHQQEAGTGGPKLVKGSTDPGPNDVEIAPGIYRY